MAAKNNINGSAKIDGKVVKVSPGQTVFDAAKKAGIYIPTLCYLENLKPYGGCRLCIVDIKNMKGFPTACTTPVEPGMEVRTKTPELQKLRREILEFTLSEHPYTCLVCGDKGGCAEFMRTTRKVGTITGCNFCTSNGDCELQDLVEYLDLKDIKYPISYRGIKPDKENPFYDLDYNLCILCGRCVRICNEERNSHVLAFVERGHTTLVGTAFGESQAEAGCEFCGACVDVCPTGSISEKMGKWTGIPAGSVETTCTMCAVGCRMNVNIKNNSVVNIGPKPGKRIHPPQVCLRGKFIPPDICNHPDRICTPRIKKINKWVEVSWKEAIEYTAVNLEKYKGNCFGILGSGQDTLEENYALQKFSRKVMRSNNIDLHHSYADREVMESIYLHYAHHAPASLEDIEKSDTLFVIGADASVSHPLAENKIRKAFTNGKKVIYANVNSTRTSAFATHEVNYSRGEGANFLYLIVAGLVRKKASALPMSIPGQFTDPDIGKAMKRSGISGSQVDQVTEALAESKNLMIIAGDDLLRNPWAKNSVNCLMNIHFIKSRENRCRILFLGNEGSLAGGILSGMHPDYLPGFQPINEKNIQKWNKHWETKLSPDKGLQAANMIQNIGKDGISALLVVGDIPTDPNLKRHKFLVQCNMFMTGLSQFANVFLPVTSFIENQGHFLSLDGKLKRVRPSVSAPGNTRPLTRILFDLATAMQETGFSGKTPASLFKELSTFVAIPFPDTKNDKPVFIPVKAMTGKIPAGFTGEGRNGYNHYRYRGNDLVRLVDDLKKVTNA